MTKLKSQEKLQWKHSELQQIPENKIGVYAFWCSGAQRFVYIGQAKHSIKDRLMQHWRGSHNPRLKKRIKNFSKTLQVCYVHLNEDRVDKVEKRLIKTFKPLANREHNPNHKVIEGN